MSDIILGMATYQDRITAAVQRDPRPISHFTYALGIGRGAFYNRLSGRTPWTLRDAADLARFLGVTIDALLADRTPAAPDHVDVGGPL